MSPVSTIGSREATAATPPQPPPEAADVRASRLLVTLGAGGALAGLLLVLAYGWTLPAIEANRAHALHAAVNEVLKAPARFETLYVVGSRITPKPPPGTDPKKFEQVYVGYGPDGRRVGFAMVAGEAGFQDVIQLIFGYDPGRGQLLGMKVLESKETPGLGDKIEKSRAFVSQFDGAQPPLDAVKRREGKRANPREIDMITGATISSRAVIRIINHTLERLGPLVEAYAREGPG
jgi:electron transport complex protein RnfG